MIPYIVTEQSLTVVIEGKAYTMNNDHPAWIQAKEALKSEEWDKLRMETLGMNEEEYLEWLDDINYMLSGTGPSKEKRKKKSS